MAAVVVRASQNAREGSLNCFMPALYADCPGMTIKKRSSLSSRLKNICLEVVSRGVFVITVILALHGYSQHVFFSMKSQMSDGERSGAGDAKPPWLSQSGRAGLVGSLVGVVISLVRQLAVSLGGGMPNLSLLERCAGALITISLFGAAAFLAALLSFLVLRAKRRPSEGPFLVIIVTVVMMCGVLFHSLAIGLRLLTGSGLTHSGLAFFLNEAGAITIAAGRQYRAYLGLVLMSVALIGLVIAYGLKRVIRMNGARFERAPAVGCTLMSGLSLLTVAIPFPDAYQRNMELISPELVVFGIAKKAAIAPSEPRKPADKLTEQALSSLPVWMEKGWAGHARDLKDKPNVVYIMLESGAWTHVGFWGYGRSTTPNIDRIAAQSLVMDRAYTTATHSNYAQMAVISSLFPRRGKTLDMYHRMDYPRFLLHDVMHELGYATATISSQDETWQGMKRFQDTETPTFYRHSPDHRGEHINIVTEEIVPDHETMRYAVEWMSAHRGQPFSLYVNFQSAHFPYRIPEGAERPFLPDDPKGTFNFVRWEEEDRQAILNRYDNALHYVDQQVGALERALSGMGILDHTILVVAADHGELFFEHDMVTHGRTLFDSEARVPLLIRYPPVLAPGRVKTPVSTLDVLPTILDLLGVAAHPAFQGESIVRVARQGVRKTGVYMNIQGWKHLEALVCPPFKVVFDPGTEEVWLYDLASDPGELRDIAKVDGEHTKKLLSVLKAQMDAQERYHEDSAEGRARRAERFAPRMLECPAP